MAQRLPPQLLRNVARLPVRFVADLYNPQMIEVLEAVGEGEESSARRAAKSMLGQCAVADFIVCASEKQRDLWLGGMGLAGLIDVDRYRVDPTFRRFVDVVPFGLPERPPRARRAGAVKGVWPGIGANDQVLLWAGGVWRWLDAITPIRAVERLRAGGRPVHLVFLGAAGPRWSRTDGADERRRGGRVRAPSAAWRASACTSTTAGCPTRSARPTSSRPTSASAPTTTTSRRASRSARACSTTSGRGCRRW